MLLLSQVYRDLSIEILLWLLGAFLLGYILRYIIGAKWRTRVGVLEKDLSAMTAKANSLEADLSTAKYEKEKTAEELAKEKSKNADLYFKLKACEEQNKAAEEANEPEKSHGDAGNDTSGALGFVAANIEVDDPKLKDLKIIEGIGPKLEEVLKNSGIANLAIMAQTKAEDMKAILNKDGERFRLADPTSWPKQAQMAVDGKWDELQEYQDVLDGGKE
jgi:predicted flap endonuclease-1-like 5' DNA nuclease